MQSYIKVIYHPNKIDIFCYFYRKNLILWFNSITLRQNLIHLYMNEMPITQTLLLNVRELCRIQGIQLRDLAAKMNMKPESLSRSLHGNPTLSTLCSVAQALRVPVSRLVAKGGDRESEDLLGVISLGQGRTRVVKDVIDLEVLLNQLRKG